MVWSNSSNTDIDPNSQSDFQYPEKIIPKFINLLMAGQPWYICMHVPNIGFGSRQHVPHWIALKLTPTYSPFLVNAARSTIHGSGHNQRNYMYVTDTAEAFLTVLRRGKIGEIESYV